MQLESSHGILGAFLVFVILVSWYATFQENTSNSIESFPNIFDAFFLFCWIASWLLVDSSLCSFVVEESLSLSPSWISSHWYYYNSIQVHTINITSIVSFSVVKDCWIYFLVGSSTTLLMIHPPPRKSGLYYHSYVIWIVYFFACHRSIIVEVCGNKMNAPARRWLLLFYK